MTEGGTSQPASAAGVRVLPESVKEGARLQIDQALRDRLCVLDSGIVYVASAYRQEDAVLEYLSLLRRNGLRFTVEEVTPKVIEDAYRSASSTVAIDTDSVRQRQVLDIIKLGVAQGASDLHFLNGVDGATVRVRVDGVVDPLRDETNRPIAFTYSDGLELCGALYQGLSSTSGGNDFSVTRSQDARLKREVATACSLQGARISSRPRPTVRGNIVVLRLLYDHNIRTFKDLGLTPAHVQMLHGYVHRRKGMFLISGGTGSGKTTTLYAACDAILKAAGYQINLMTVEDPVEATVPGAVQTELNVEMEGDHKATERAWSQAIRNCVRLDPDVLFVGEIRDREGALAAVEYAMTGHGLLSTVHTENATQVLDRLRNLGVDESLLADAVIVRGLMNQSLAPVTCPTCRIPYMKARARLPEEVVERVERYCQDRRTIYVRGRDRACPTCNGRGVRGRIAVAEIVMSTQALLDTWRRAGGAQMRRQWVEQGGKPKSARLAELVCAGIVDPVVGEQEVCLLSDDHDEDPR